jgi:drug/metabolite transporter (DMT)-like permease
MEGTGRLFTRERGAELALIGITVIWGLTFVFTKNSLKELQPFVFLAWRFAIALAAMAVLCIPRYSKMDWKVVLAGVILGSVLFSSYAFQTFGLKYTTAGNAGFITGLFIVFTPLLAWAFLGHKQSPKAIVAVGVALTGLAFLSLTPDLTINAGDALVLVCAFTYSVHIILLDGYTKKYDLALLTLVQMGVLFVLNTAAGFAFETVKAPPTAYVWMSVIVCGLLASALAFYVQGFAQRVLTPSRTSMVLIMEPVFSLIFGMILLAERLTWRGWVGCALIMAGMVITEWPSRIDKAKQA